MAWDLTLEEKASVRQSVETAASFNSTYATMMVLSTIIAAYGLLSNSTATVIGAMIVAPLLGPILGLALAFVQGRRQLFQRALLTAGAGVALCVATAGLVGLLVDPANINFMHSEIASRTRPTLYDLMVALAAGLVAAYTTVDRRLSSAIAGVAVAVALETPLTVTGLSLVGAWQTGLPWRPVAGSFLLFLASFLAIELAAALVFFLAGLGNLRLMQRSREVLGMVSVQIVLLGCTFYFLAGQLQVILRHSQLERKARGEAQAVASTLPGVGLEEVSVDETGTGLEVEVLLRAPTEVPLDTIATLRNRLSERLGSEVTLSVGTILSTYYGARGRLYTRAEKPPDPTQVLLQQSERSLRRALSGFPGTDLEQFRLLETKPEETSLMVTVISPYPFDAYLVGRLEQAAGAELSLLAGRPMGMKLTVRTVLSQEFTSSGPIEREAVHDPQWYVNRELKLRLDQQLRSRAESVPGGLLLSSSLILTGTEPEMLEVEAVIRSARALTARQISSWQKELSSSLERKVHLKVDNRLGTTLEGPLPPSP